MSLQPTAHERKPDRPTPHTNGVATGGADGTNANVSGEAARPVDGYFARVPQRLLNDPRSKFFARTNSKGRRVEVCKSMLLAVYAAISSHERGGNGRGHPSTERIAALAGVSRVKANDAVQALELAGYLTVGKRQVKVRGTLTTVNQYTLTDFATGTVNGVSTAHPVNSATASTAHFSSEHCSQTEVSTVHGVSTNQKKEAEEGKQNPPTPKGGGRACDGEQDLSPNADPFETFLWSVYPALKRGRRDLAERQWRKLDADAALCERIRQAVHSWKRSPEWLREEGRYIPAAWKWLKGKQWQAFEDGANQRVPTEEERRRQMAEKFREIAAREPVDAEDITAKLRRKKGAAS